MLPFQFVPPESGRSVSPLSLALQFEHGLERQEHICRSLELLADDLPARVNTHEALLLMNRLRILLHEVHRFEETVILATLVQSHRDLEPVIDRLRAEHAEDEDHAADLEEAFATLATQGCRRLGAEGVAYMMRCLFVGLRRHIAFDRDHIRPLLGP